MFGTTDPLSFFCSDFFIGIMGLVYSLVTLQMARDF